MARSISPTGMVRPDDVLDSVKDGHADIATVSRAAARCRACDLWARATQTVFGEGPREARGWGQRA